MAVHDSIPKGRIRRTAEVGELVGARTPPRDDALLETIGSRTAGDRQPARRLGQRPVLDGVRGIAVLLVIAVHVGLLASGDIGVDVFFPLSGFLITALLYEEWERQGALSLRRFYARRARRLLPALTMLVVAFAVLSRLVPTFSAAMPKGTLVGSTLLFANNWVAALSPAHGRALGPLAPTWSLAQEGQFYLLWPAVLAVLLRWRRRTSFVLCVLGVSIVVLVAAVPIVRHAYPAYGAYTSPMDRSAELLLGCAAAILWRERRLPPPLGRPITAWVAFAGLAFVLAQAGAPHRTWYLAAAVLTTLLIVSLLTAGDAGPASGRSSRRFAARAPGALSTALSSTPLRFTGRVSYGVYLYHLPIYYLLLNYAPARSHYFYGAVVLAAGLLAAAGSWKLLESPIIHGITPGARILTHVTCVTRGWGQGLRRHAKPPPRARCGRPDRRSAPGPRVACPTPDRRTPRPPSCAQRGFEMPRTKTAAGP